MSGVTAAAMLAGVAMSAVNGMNQNNQAKKAAAQAQVNAKKQEQAADEAANRSNQKRANTGAALDAAAQAGRGGASGTMLTGPQGVDPSALNLGKNTLLGS